MRARLGWSKSEARRLRRTHGPDRESARQQRHRRKAWQRGRLNPKRIELARRDG